MSESAAIAVIREMLSAPAPALEVGVGDDAAVFHFAGGSIILTVDSIYEGIHFTLDTCGLADIGWKAMAASVSDIAAMGGQPLCALMSVAFGAPPTEDEVRALLGGALEMSGSCNCSIIGGDICRSSSGLGVSVTVAGTPHAYGPVLRSGAREGDIIGVTGTLGDSAGGLYVLKSGHPDLRAKFPALVDAHLRPESRIPAGEILASCGASAMEDVSDGLAADLVHICQESDVGCEIYSEAIPLSGELRALANEARCDPLQWALAGGEDYELVFTAPEERFSKALSSLAEREAPATRIGVVAHASKGTRLIAPDGRAESLEGLGYDHFLK